MTAVSRLPFDADEMRLLAEVGFLAAANAQLPAARRIFGALRLLRPDSVLPFIGQAVVATHEGKPDEAVRLLEEEGLGKIPGDAELTSFLGLSLVEAGRLAEAARVLRALDTAAAPDEPHMRMAAGLLRSLEGPGPAGRRAPIAARGAVPGAAVRSLKAELVSEGVRHAR